MKELAGTAMPSEPYAQLLPDAFGGSGRRLIHLYRCIFRAALMPAIPSTASRKEPIPYNKATYRQRNLIERMFARLRDFRRVASIESRRAPRRTSPRLRGEGRTAKRKTRTRRG
jgi:transposase